ncbi:DNA sulfur modification protein DndB [Geminocystis herdmanii]|uniref:DNA sulfur modification protein DndB n=1 Tax=Geminocystis herdmanii TaxID=669359 RepID=UPI00192CA0BE|nr:DNA sulfur modification protein DndB [Geminocystis herdmanii]
MNQQPRLIVRALFKDTRIPVILYHSDIKQSHNDSYLEINNEDYANVIAKAVIDRVPIFRDLTEMKRSSLPMRSHYLFTLSSIDKATQALLINYDDDEKIFELIRCDRILLIQHHIKNTTLLSLIKITIYLYLKQ